MDCTISIKAPRLKIKHKLSKAEVLKHKHDHLTLFKTALEIDVLLDQFQYDPWSRQIRRGEIGATK